MKKIPAKIEFGSGIPPMGPDHSGIDLNDAQLGDGEQKRLEKIIDAAGGSVACEEKEDGYRCQPHVDKKRVQLFTRNLNEFEPRCFPDIVDALQSLQVKKTILDAELKGTAAGYQGFNVMKKRAKYLGSIGEEKIQEYVASGEIESHPLELIVFDVLMYAGKPKIELPYAERRKIVEDIVARGNNTLLKHSSQQVFAAPELVHELYQSIMQKKGEGIVLKQPNLEYIPGDKSHWLKFKRFETLDLVVVGLLPAEKELKCPIDFGRALVASYNDMTQVYETIGVVNLARRNEATGKLFAEEVEVALQEKVSHSQYARVNLGKKTADVYIDPDNSIVLEVRAMNIDRNVKRDFSSGYSLRIAYVKTVREDKSPQQATTTAEIARLQSQ